MKRRSDYEPSSGFINSPAPVGSAMISMGLFSDDHSMRIMGGGFMAPAVVKYSAMAGRAFYDSFCGSGWSRKFKKIGRNFNGKSLDDGL